ncbi:MAG: hypothetical protein WDW38_000444 [Sanguina aurantia]
MVLPPVDGKALEGTLKDLKLSTEEVDKFGKAFKDPEFLKMFEEYAKEVSDPKVKAETDLYLRQLEREGRAEETYGKGVQLIAPAPCFVLKTADTKSGEKLFINVCSSGKLEPAAKREEVGPGGKRGLLFQIPLSLGIKRTTTDKKGKPATVVEFVVHPDTIEQAHASRPIMGVLTETAMETIEKAAKVTLNRAFKVVKNLKFKTSEGVDRPPVLSIRTTAVDGKASTPGELMRPVSGSSGPAPATLPLTSASLASALGGDLSGSAEAGAGAGSAGGGGGPAIRSNFSFGQTEKGSSKGASAAKQDPSQPGFLHSTGEVTPDWTLVHRGTIDLADSWGDAGKGLAAVNAPKELVVKFQLPLIASAAAVDLDVTRTKVVLTVPGKYHVELPLPHPVDGDRGKAKFDKAKHTLEVVMPVLPPPRPQPTKQQLAAAAAAAAAAAEPASLDTSDTASAADQMHSDNSSSSEGASPASLSGTSAPSSSSPAAHPSDSPSHPTMTSSSREGDASSQHQSTTHAPGECGSAALQHTDQDLAVLSAGCVEDSGFSSGTAPAAPDPAALTENERRWLELHREEVVVVDGQEACTGSSVGTGACADTSGAVAAGAPPCTAAADARAALEAAGIVQAPMRAAAGVVQAPSRPQPVMLLQPRLTKSLAMDLD